MKEITGQRQDIAPVALGWKKMMVGVALLLGATVVCLLIVRYVFL